MIVPSPPPAETIEGLRAALAEAQAARLAAEARAMGAEALVAHLKLEIAKLRRDCFGASSERGRKLLDQLELQLEDVEATATEDECAVEAAAAKGGGGTTDPLPTRGRTDGRLADRGDHQALSEGARAHA